MSRALPAPIRPRRDLAVPAGLFVATILLILGGNLAGNGALMPVVQGEAMVLPGWEHGSLLNVLAVWVGSWLGFVDAATAQVLVYVALASVGAILAYHFLRVSDWPAPQALLALTLIASHAILLFAVTRTSQDFLLVLAAGALIPALRRLEAVGDVQSIINFGLTLPLLLMAGAPLAALIPLLVLVVPFREPEARQKPQVFAAMLLVAIVPTLIIITGVWAMAARAGVGLGVLLEPFANAFTPSRSSALPMVLLLAATAPVALVLVAHGLIPDRRRKLLTTLVALILPFYLAIGDSLFAWDLEPWLPAAAMMATVLGWLCATRLRPWMHWLTLALLSVSAAASWFLVRLWADPLWLQGLLPVQFYGLRLTLPGLS